MMLKDVKDFIKSLKLSDYTYMGVLDNKKEKSIGVYYGKREVPYKTAIGGASLQSYGVKSVSLLIHWNKSPSETERASMDVFEALRDAREVSVNNSKIKFIQLMHNEPIDVGTDENGIHEMVIEAAVIYQK